MLRYFTFNHIMILKMDMTLIEWIHLQSLLQVNAQTFIRFIRKRVCGLSVYFHG